MAGGAWVGGDPVAGSLRRCAVENLIGNDPSDPYTRGMIPWRYKTGQSVDATGTAEALRIAQGLLIGGQTFPGRQSDVDLGILILTGYAHHQYLDQGTWLIRNYFNLQTRNFGNNSYVVDYDPDLLAQAAAVAGNAAFEDPNGDYPDLPEKQLGGVAERSASLVRRAVAPAGLLYDVVQPGITARSAELDLAAFSPNDVVSFLNSCTVAEHSAESAPEVARRVLDFANGQPGGPKKYYLGRSGELAHPAELGLEANACLVRLAAKLGDQAAHDRYLPVLRGQVASFAESPYEPRLYLASEALLALHANVVR